MKPILFSTLMVQAILDGRKTQTRRVIKPQPSNGVRKSVFVKSGLEDGHGREIKLRYPPGTVLWVRETWRERWGMAYANYGTGSAYPVDDVREIEYKAGGNGFFVNGCNFCPDEITVKWGEWSKWKPSIHMPKEAARIFLLVKSVYPERLQDITEEDAIAEGVDLNFGARNPNVCKWQNYRDAYRAVWDSLNAKRGYPWESDPWIWKYVFERMNLK